MDVYCDWCYKFRNNWVDNLVSKEYKGNSVEISVKHISIKKKKLVTTNICRIFWVYKIKVVTSATSKFFMSNLLVNIFLVDLIMWSFKAKPKKVKKTKSKERKKDAKN
jgi:hypothetical protein